MDKLKDYNKVNTNHKGRRRRRERGQNCEESIYRACYDDHNESPW
jgi:hypothetical protein